MLLTSCEGTLDDVFGEWDRPTPTNNSGSGSTPAASSISYMAWNTTSEQLEEKTISSGYIVLASATAATDLAAGTYVVNDNISITGNLTLSGDANIILCDGAELTVNGCIYGGADYGTAGTYSLNIYGQTNQTGKLTVVNNDINVVVKNLYIHGGDIDVTTGGVQQGIEPTNGDLYIYGGKVNVAGVYNGIMMNPGDLYVLGGTLVATSTNGDAIAGATNATFSNCTATISHTGGTMLAINGTTNLTIASGLTYYEGTSANPSTTGSATAGGGAAIHCAKEYVEIK